MIKFILNIIVSLLVFISVIRADDNFTFDYDYSVFREESTKVFIEFYYSFDPHLLVFQKSNSEYEASGRLKIELVRKQDLKTVALKEFKVPITLKDTSGSFKDIKLTGQINIVLDTGLYVMKVTAGDFNDESSNAYSEKEIHLEDFPKSSFSISNVQLGSNIFKSNDVNNIFYKNTLEVIPNPSLLFGNNLSKLFYYLELYNLNKPELGDFYNVVSSIADINGNDIKSSKKTYDVKSESKVEFGSFDVSDLPSNKYLFFVKVLDADNNEQKRTFKNFYIFNSDTSNNTNLITEVDNDYLLSEYPLMKEPEINDEFDKAIYIMSDLQKKQFKSLTFIDAKKMYMFKFWQSIKNILPKKSYMERIEYSNKNFKSDFRDGWKTDRGRVYAIYGKYDEIERFPYEGSTRAYELWTYNTIQGGAIFVFIDMSAGYGDYTLVHSSAQNEVRDDNWKDKLPIR